MKALAAFTSSASSMSTSSVTWKLPSPTWPTIGATSLLLGDVALGLGDAFGEPRDRHADIGRDDLARRAAARQADSRRRAAPARAGCAPPAWWSIRTARRRTRRRSRRSARDCSATPASVPWNSRNSIGVSRQRELGIGVDRLHLQLVEQFDARDRDAGLDGQDGGVAGRLDRRERADAAGDRLRDAVRASASVR